jgi:hypothetical protein
MGVSTNFQGTASEEVRESNLLVIKKIALRNLNSLKKVSYAAKSGKALVIKK